MPPTPEVRFENQGEEFGMPPRESNGFDIAGMLVRWKLVASRKEAEYVLIAVAVLGILATVFMLWSALGGGGGSVPPPPPNLAPNAM